MKFIYKMKFIAFEVYNEKSVSRVLSYDDFGSFKLYLIESLFYLLNSFHRHLSYIAKEPNFNGPYFHNVTNHSSYCDDQLRIIYTLLGKNGSTSSKENKNVYSSLKYLLSVFDLNEDNLSKFNFKKLYTASNVISTEFTSGFRIDAIVHGTIL